MLGKLLLLALAIWMILLLLKQYRRGVQPPRAPRMESQDMVSCKECGVHLPKSESILKQGAYYCSKEHSDKAGQ